MYIYIYIYHILYLNYKLRLPKIGNFGYNYEYYKNTMILRLL